MTPPFQQNRPSGFDPVTRLLHWLTALLILSAIALGLWMTRLPATSEPEVAAVFRAFSLHKTIGVAAFFTAFIRIIWAMTHAHPGPLHPDHRVENFTASTAHWALYAAMLIMPLSGWVFHAASPGYAPILWPFTPTGPQTLPLVPASETLAQIADTIHKLSAWVLYAAIALHVAGAVKHAVIDRDATLARILSGKGPAVPPPRPTPWPALAATALWLAVISYGWMTAPVPEPDPFSDLGQDLPAAP